MLQMFVLKQLCLVAGIFVTFLFESCFWSSFFWGVLHIRNIHKKLLNKRWCKLQLRKSLCSQKSIRMILTQCCPYFFHSVTKHQLLAMTGKEASKLNYDSGTFGLASCYVWDFCKYVTFWCRRVINAYPQCSAKVMLDGLGKHCKLNKAVLQDCVS